MTVQLMFSFVADGCLALTLFYMGVAYPDVYSGGYICLYNCTNIYICICICLCLCLGLPRTARVCGRPSAVWWQVQLLCCLVK